MAKLTVEIDKRTKFGRFFYNLIRMTARENKEVKIYEDHFPNKETRAAIKEIEKGKGRSVKSSKQLFKELGI